VGMDGTNNIPAYKARLRSLKYFVRTGMVYKIYFMNNLKLRYGFTNVIASLLELNFAFFHNFH
jgi:hypothetical protein